MAASLSSFIPAATATCASRIFTSATYRSADVRTLFHLDDQEISLPPGHKYPTRKYRMLRDLLAADGNFHFEPAPFASRQAIERVHDSTYVEQFLTGTLPTAAMWRIGFPWSESLVRRTLGSVGGTLAAAREAISSKAFGGNLAGGTHHAFRAEGSGFCVFNDIAVAILMLREEYGVERAAVIDLDVHQGDGTALIFEHDALVLTLSLHGKNNFPFRKQRSRIDIELPDRIGDDEYLSALAPVLPKVFEFKPDVIFYQSGVDALASDVLGRLALTSDGLKERDRMVMQAARQYGAPFVITLGGGYSDPIELTAAAHANTFRTAALTWPE
jgi:acetoin utilization deacetylase AcuC-like enzyme